jgi:hypothetical protein
MKRTLLVTLFAVGYVGAFALGWHADQRIAILQIEEYAELVNARAALRSIMNDPRAVCQKYL